MKNIIAFKCCYTACWRIYEKGRKRVKREKLWLIIRGS